MCLDKVDMSERVPRREAGTAPPSEYGIYKIGQRRIGNSSRVWRSDLFATDARSDGGGLGKVRGVHMSGEWRVSL